MGVGSGVGLGVGLGFGVGLGVGLDVGVGLGVGIGLGGKVGLVIGSRPIRLCNDFSIPEENANHVVLLPTRASPVKPTTRVRRDRPGLGS